MLDVSVVRGLRTHGVKLFSIIFADLMLCQIICFAELFVGKAFLSCGYNRSLMALFLHLLWFCIKFKMAVSSMDVIQSLDSTRFILSLIHNKTDRLEI